MSDEVPVADATEVVRQSRDEALAHDLGLIAEAKGWTIEEATADHEAAEAIGQLASQVAKERPNVYVGAALSESPGGAPTLYVKGSAGPFIRDLVGASGIEVVVADGQPFSFDELEARKLRVHHALEDLGFRNVATSVNITGGGVIPAGVMRQQGLPGRVQDILAALPADLRSSVKLTINDAPVVTDLEAFGGMRVRAASGEVCTSGWSVRDLDTGRLGITTAGHCHGMGEVSHPGHGVHVIQFSGEHRGQWGDIEWHQSDEREPDDFYADASTIRDVSSIEPRTSIVVGDSVCVYGRTSNDRDCSLDVQDVSQACTNNGVFNDRLVMMDGKTSSPGDSGGGWSLANTAFGSVKGFCYPDFPNNEVWSVADLYDEALGVKVTCAC